MAYFLFALCAVASAMAMTPQELESFLYSPNGLDMAKQESQRVAQEQAPILTQSMVTIDDLKSLMGVLYSPNVLDFSKSELRAQLLPLAEQHLDPTELKPMHDVLYGASSLDLDKSTARSRTIAMVKYDADPTQLKDLFQTLRNKLSLTKAFAQAKSLELGAAGCDPVALEKSYLASKDLASASDSAMRANLNGEMRRYCKDGKAYTVAETQSYYGAQWMTEWLAAPLEKRVAEDSKEYTAREFRAHYSSVWEQKWHAAQTSTQMRLADNGKPYTMNEFVEYYKDNWQQKWSQAPVLPCKECKSSQDSHFTFNTLRSMLSRAWRKTWQDVVTV